MVASKNILWFKEINKNDTPKVGGKGANLGEMFSAKISVPDGFCVTVVAYKLFLEENKLQDKLMKKLDGLDVEDTKKLDVVSAAIRALIVDANVPKDVEKDIVEAYKKINDFVAVRSSATAEDLADASFAGQQATFLNVKGSKDVVRKVKECWASLFTSRAIYYRENKKFEHSKVFISVVVQNMINSDCAGVMFTANPITNSRDEMVIEGSYGLGESVVSGMVTPDSYFVDKKTLKPKNVSVGTKSIILYRDSNGKNKERKATPEESEKQLLTEKQIAEIAKMGIHIENHYKSPQDIEWAIEKNILYITQSRPITTLK